MGAVGVAETVEQVQDMGWYPTGLPGELVVVGAGGVEQQQGVPGGAVSTTTKVSWASATVRAKAWKTAISSVHGEAMSSARTARAASSRSAPAVMTSAV